MTVTECCSRRSPRLRNDFRSRWKRLEQTKIISIYSAVRIRRRLRADCTDFSEPHGARNIRRNRAVKQVLWATNFTPTDTMRRRQGRAPTVRPWNALCSGQSNLVHISDNSDCFSSAISSQRAAGFLHEVTTMPDTHCWHKPVEGPQFLFCANSRQRASNLLSPPEGEGWVRESK